MGVIIDVRDHSLTVERTRISDLQKEVDNDISKISESLNSLNSYWKDEKSVSAINELNGNMEEVKKANNDAKTATEDYLQKIGQILKMNYGE